MRKTISVAITMGDPGGIGAEVALKALAGARFTRSCRFLVVGSRKVALRAAKALKLPAPHEWDKSASAREGVICVWEPGRRDRDMKGRAFREYPVKFVPGRTSKTNALAAAEWIRAAVDGCARGEFDAMIRDAARGELGDTPP